MPLSQQVCPNSARGPRDTGPPLRAGRLRRPPAKRATPARACQTSAKPWAPEGSCLSRLLLCPARCWVRAAKAQGPHTKSGYLALESQEPEGRLGSAAGYIGVAPNRGRGFLGDSRAKQRAVSFRAFGSTGATGRGLPGGAGCSGGQCPHQGSGSRPSSPRIDQRRQASTHCHPLASALWTRAGPLAFFGETLQALRRAGQRGSRKGCKLPKGERRSGSGARTSRRVCLACRRATIEHANKPKEG